MTDKTVNTIEIFQSDKFYLLNIWSSWCVPCRARTSNFNGIRKIMID